MSSSGPEATTGRPGRRGLLRRLGLLLLIGAGLLLWRSPLLPQPHTLVWDRPFGLDLASAEVQLWRGDTLLARCPSYSPQWDHRCNEQGAEGRSGAYAGDLTAG
jgi:hypothetical protein